MARTAEPEGWTSQFREIMFDVKLEAHDLRGDEALFGEALRPDSYTESQALAADLRAAGSDGIAYPSCRQPGGECVALFYSDLQRTPFRGDTSTITGMVRGSISTARSAAAPSTASRLSHERHGDQSGTPQRARTRSRTP
ncbi:hypothetical protein GCM10011390_45860 [Aureimonas endophytica]|uniref:RES domain-containing protein n=1 Tax=Aureimonas endophytica TaxID=2027858 RepID=A0A917A0U8_9HYPH|nr:RES family NAD+ phosphorylase [Aureimonas endophytica]GGE21359.1 hypothetical protein GCM10011390_45860 [Aureimonas endophytica]